MPIVWARLNGTSLLVIHFKSLQILVCNMAHPLSLTLYFGRWKRFWISIFDSELSMRLKATNSSSINCWVVLYSIIQFLSKFVWGVCAHMKSSSWKSHQSNRIFPKFLTFISHSFNAHWIIAGRLTNRERQQTITDEILADPEIQASRKRRFENMQQENQKWNHRKQKGSRERKIPRKKRHKH